MAGNSGEFRGFSRKWSRFAPVLGKFPANLTGSTAFRWIRGCVAGILCRRCDVSNGIVTLSLLAIAASLSLTSCSRLAAKTDDPPAVEIPVRTARAVIEDVP